MKINTEIANTLTIEEIGAILDNAVETNVIIAFTDSDIIKQEIISEQGEYIEEQRVRSGKLIRLDKLSKNVYGDRVYDNDINDLTFGFGTTDTYAIIYDEDSIKASSAMFLTFNEKDFHNESLWIKILNIETI